MAFFNEAFTIDDFASGVSQLMTTFVNFGDELTALNDIDDQFFSAGGAVNSPKLGANLKQIWQEAIENDLGEFITGYNSWVAMAKAEGTLREDFQHEELDLFAKAQANLESMTSGLTPIPGMGDGLNPTGAESTDDPISLSGLTEEEATAGDRLTYTQRLAVEQAFEGNGDTSNFNETQQLYLNSLNAYYLRDVVANGFTLNGANFEIDTDTLQSLLTETKGMTQDEMTGLLTNTIMGGTENFANTDMMQ